MTDSSITVRKADLEHLDRIEALLEANDLPYRDVRAKPECFFLATSAAELIGSGGIEIYGSAGLLRSIVITESNRGQGYGKTLIDSLEDRARSNEVETLYLLTTTESEFFRQCGYEEIARTNVPASIQRTSEFADFCPASATCMTKELG